MNKLRQNWSQSYKSKLLQDSAEALWCPTHHVSPVLSTDGPLTQNPLYAFTPTQQRKCRQYRKEKKEASDSFLMRRVLYA